MKVYRDIEILPEFSHAVVTIGTFDGVHLGHQKIIDQLKNEAARVNGETVIITFHPHPRKIVLADSNKVKLLTTIEERIELLSEKGIDNLVIVPFTKGFSELEPAKYVEEFLFAKFRPAVVIIGYDHRFGQQRKGDYKLLEEYCGRGYFELKEIPQHLINHSTVSSTVIRNSLLEGNVKEAGTLLGYDFFFEGVVVKGDQIGRTIGYPTANIQLLNEDKLVPADGVYVVEAELNKGVLLKGMMSIGVRPTVSGTTRRIEVNILDFDKDIYGETMRVYVRDYIRPELKLNGLAELKAKIDEDKRRAEEFFGEG